MASNGILPTRDAASHALQLGTFLNPDMPGSFNELIRDVSERAGSVAGTLSQRDAYPMDKRFPGLCWVVLPDNPSAANTSVELHYWSGTYWDTPDRRQRILRIPRSSFDASADRPINRNERFDVLYGTWRNAPQGAYLIHGDYTIQAATFSEMIVGSSRNGTSFGDYRDDVDNLRTVRKFDAAVTDHPGGDLEIKIWVTMIATSAAIYNAGSALTITYLGRTAN